MTDPFASPVSIVRRAKSQTTTESPTEWFSADDRGQLRAIQQTFLRKLRGNAPAWQPPTPPAPQASPTGWQLPPTTSSGGVSVVSAPPGAASVGGAPIVASSWHPTPSATPWQPRTVPSLRPSDVLPSARPMPPASVAVAAFRPASLPRVQIWRGPSPDGDRPGLSPIRRGAAAAPPPPTEAAPPPPYRPLGGTVALTGTSRHAKRRRLLRERRMNGPNEVAPLETMDVAERDHSHSTMPLMESVYRANAPLHFDPEALTEPHDVFVSRHRRGHSSDEGRGEGGGRLTSAAIARMGHPPELSADAAARRLWQRRRQLELGLRTTGYHVYCVMKERGEPVPIDAGPPPPEQHCSKRSWDGQMRRWRHILHAYDTYALTLSDVEQAMVRERLDRDHARRLAARAEAAAAAMEEDDDDDEEASSISDVDSEDSVEVDTDDVQGEMEAEVA